MAATVSPWSKPGAWALEAEENEAELLKQHNESESVSDFPTLNAAVATKPSKKKKKGQTVSLQEFSAYGGPKPSTDSSGLTPDDIVSLPKGPRERTEEEIARASRGGGGFRSFDRSGPGEESRWSGAGSGRGGDRERRDGGREVRDLGPSRADEVDNWASSKKPLSVGYERRERDGGRDRERGGFFDSQSKADESDNWVSNKSYAPAPRFDRERRGGMGFGLSNGSSDSDFWGKKREESSAEIGTVSRPRLNLQPRTLPVEKPESVEKPEITAAPAFVAAPKAKGANPFGAARPREEVLAEKRQDWKKIDEQLESMKIRETGERFGKQRGFGSGNGRSDAAWKKPVPTVNGGGEADGGDAQSADKNEDEAVEEQN